MWVIEPLDKQVHARRAVRDVEFGGGTGGSSDQLNAATRGADRGGIGPASDIDRTMESDHSIIAASPPLSLPPDCRR